MPDGSSGFSLCSWCDEPVLEHEPVKWIPHLGDIGDPVISKPWHVECLLRSIIGGINHQKGLCRCRGCRGTEPPDPPEMTIREAARAALEYYDERHPIGG